MKRLSISAASFLVILLLASIAYAEMSKKEVLTLLNELDARQRALGDFKAVVFMEQQEKDKSKLVYQAVTYRRENEEKFIFLFLKPKAEAGKGYLTIDRNLFLYDPTVGKWERRTERERIGGTDSRRQDFDVRNLARDYTGEWVGSEKLGNFETDRIKLTAKEGASVAFPTVHLWVDKKSKNPLKQQDFSKSGKLLRTLYFPKWEKVFNEKKKSEMYYPREIRIYDELNKGNQTIIVLQDVELGDLPENVFTKAWVESKSR